MKKSLLVNGIPLLGILCSGLSGQAAGTSEVAGIYKIELKSAAGGANFIAAPLHGKPVFRGRIASVSGNTVTLSGNPRLTASAYNEADLGAATFAQYIVIITSDASSSPGNAGDWFGVVSNTDKQLTLTPGLITPATSFGAGDVIEIRKLTSMKDLFGSGASCILNKDTDLDINQSQEDYIRLLAGAGFAEQIFYHDPVPEETGLDEGYYVGTDFDADGSRITLAPDEAVMLFRKTASPIVNSVVLGNAQTTPFTHLLGAGANALASSFPVESPIGTSNLKESGWISDTDLDINASQENLIRVVVGSSFTSQIFHHDPVPEDTGLDAGWYVGVDLDNTYGIPADTGLMYFAISPLVWRQPAPFKL